MTNKFRVKLSSFRVMDLNTGDKKSAKSLYLKVNIDSEKHYSYVEKNAKDECEWHTNFGANVEYSSLSELKNREVTIILYEKNRGLFGKDVCLGGFKVDFLTLASGPAIINMPIQSSNAALSGRMSMNCEFEHFSETIIQFSDLVLDSPSLQFNSNNVLAIHLMSEALPEVIWDVNQSTVYTNKENVCSWSKVPQIKTVMSLRTLFSGLSVKIYKKTNNSVFNECVFPLLKYSNLESRPVPFEENIFDENGSAMGKISGILLLTNMPILSQMPSGSLTELGVKDPTVMIPEVPLPRCAIYRSVVEMNEPQLPWVKVEVFNSTPFYYNNVTFEKKVFELNKSSYIVEKASSMMSTMFLGNKSSSMSSVTEKPLNENSRLSATVSSGVVGRGSELAVERSKIIKGWICSCCTFVNEKDCLVCSICNASSPLIVG